MADLVQEVAVTVPVPRTATVDGRSRVERWSGLDLADMLCAQALATPDRIAVRQWDDVLTYRELVARAAALAAHCGRPESPRPGRLVGVCLGRTPAMVVAALGILLSGGWYVPLDLGHPRGRLHDIIADARVASWSSTPRDATRWATGAAGLRVLPPPAGSGDGDGPPEAGMVAGMVQERAGPGAWCPAGPENLATCSTPPVRPGIPRACSPPTEVWPRTCGPRRSGWPASDRACGPSRSPRSPSTR